MVETLTVMLLHRVRRGGALFVLLVVGMLSAAVSGASAAGWQPPTNAAVGDYGGVPEVAVDAQGKAVAVWKRHISGIEWSVVASTRPLGGQWSAPVDISRTATSMTDRTLLAPEVAVDPQGNAVAIWIGRDDPPGNDEVPRSLWASSRPVGGQWSEPVKIAAIGGDLNRDVVIDASGTATVVWTQYNEEETGTIVRTSSRPLGGSWSAPVDLSGVSSGRSAVAVNPDGDLTAVWIKDEVLQSKGRPAGGEWSAQATDLSSDAGSAGDPAVVIDQDGDATAVWSYSENGDLVAQAAHSSGPDGTWSAPVQLWDEATGQVALAVDPQRNVTAIWNSFGPGGNVMRSSSSAAGGAWSTPVALSAADGGDVPTAATNSRIVADQQGNLTAIWKAAVGPGEGPGFPGSPIPVDNYRLQTAYRPAGAEWGAPVTLVGPGDFWTASLAVDPQGYVTALWSETSAVRSRVFDLVAPLLNDVQVPARGVVGQPVAMSVDPFDLWSSVTTSWDFGDGGSGSGATIAHCYSSPGQRTVTITGTDLAGNATSTSQAVTIDPDPNAAPCTPPDPGPAPAGPSPAPGPGPVPPPQPLLNAPVLSGLKQSSSHWRTHKVKRGPRLPVGTTFQLQLDRAAQLRFAFSQIVSGRKVNGHCVKATKTNRRKSRCDRYQTGGTLTITGKAGTNTVAFRGTIRGQTLKPGRYRLLVTALADGKTSKATSMRFTIAR
jgi:hypothetical protein